MSSGAVPAVTSPYRHRHGWQRSLGAAAVPPRTAGHREVPKAVRRIVRACSERDIEVLTLFAFSSENWRRPRPEVEVLLKLFLTTLRGEIRRLDTANVRLRFIGDYGPFPKICRITSSRPNADRRQHRFDLGHCRQYGGRWDGPGGAPSVRSRAGRPIATGRYHAGCPASFTCLSDLPDRICSSAPAASSASAIFALADGVCRAVFYRSVVAGLR